MIAVFASLLANMIAPPFPLSAEDLQARRIISNFEAPHWIDMPSGDDLDRYFPTKVRDLEKPGAVAMECRIAVTGGFEACTALAAYPTNQGFDGAAMRLARILKTKPGAEAIRPAIGTTVRFRLNFPAYVHLETNTQ